MSRYQDFLKRAKQAHGDKFDDSQLCGIYVLPYENGNRIEVMFDGVKKRGYVGITTGWRPLFILLLTRRSIGSSWILDGRTNLLKVIE